MEDESERLKSLFTERLRSADISIRSLASTVDDLSLVNLVLSAKEAGESAYAPYSNYQVGSAILLANGEVIKGWNVENEEYSATICAESAAIARLDLDQRKKVIAISVYAHSSLPRPCGGCRQRMAELGYDFVVITVNGKGELELYSAKALLPN